MKLTIGLSQLQTTKLAMTQELSQAIALLHYSALELTAFLEEKALDNPLIELERKEVSIHTYEKQTRTPSSGQVDEQTDWLEQIGEKTTLSLRDHLLPQVNFTGITAEVEATLNRVIDYIDDNGYLRIDRKELAGELAVRPQVLGEAIALLHELEPAGIGASDLQQCLLLQAKRLDPPHDLAVRIIEKHFLLFAEKNWRELAKKEKVSLQEIQSVFDVVQTLNPRPGAGFTTEDAPYIIPDLLVTKTDGKFVVEVVNEHIPAVLFNETYYNELAKSNNQEVTDFLREKRSDYHWMRKSIQQRNETLKKVMTAIVEKQQAFFENDKNALVPMTMNDIALAIDMHESTVSRSVNDKHVQTAVGTFTLRSFFTQAVATETAEETSSAQVKEEIEKIIAREDKNKPLSDQKIVAALKETSGIIVSRRTVAKYREQLGIPSSPKRKRFD